MSTDSGRRQVITVTGPIAPEAMGVTDAHNHLWIAPPAGAPPDAPRLEASELIKEQLCAYRRAGGGAIVDCQPGRAGRNALVLRALALASQVKVIACTGFHLRRYYPSAEPLWGLAPEAAAEHFVRELAVGVEESLAGDPIRAGFIKIACEATLEASPLALMEAAAAAARRTGAAIEVHTERGEAAEAIAAFFERQGLPPRQLVLCHVDKRPDVGLHRDLARAGVLLEYDTFYRPRYRPEQGVWPLLAQMAADGLAGSVAIATDMAESALWREPGLTGLLTMIAPRLRQMDLRPEDAAAMLGGNIAARLAR